MKVPCKVLVATAAIGLFASSAVAQDAYYGNSPFEGVYLGAYGGAAINPGTNATLGITAGANFSITDNILVGVEGQTGAVFGPTTTYDALALARLGYEVDDQFLIYGAAGGGAINGVNSYAIGAGAEALVIDQIGVRGEVLGSGAWGGGVNSTKATAGVIWHVR